MSTAHITTGTTARQGGTVITLASGAACQVHTDVNLEIGEYVVLERTYDGGTTWRPAGSAKGLLNAEKKDNIFYGPGEFRCAISDTATETVVYIDV